MIERAHTMAACYFLAVDGCGDPAAWRFEEGWPCRPVDVCEHHHDFMAAEPELWKGSWARIGEAAE